MPLSRLGPSAVLLLLATVALLATVLARPPSLASAWQAETALDGSIEASSAVVAGHDDWTGSEKLPALERIPAANDDREAPGFQGDEPPEPGGSEEPPEPGDSTEPDEPVEPEEPDEPPEPEEPVEPEEPAEPEEPVEPEEPAEAEEVAEAAEPSGPVASPDTGAGLIEQQITVSIFLAVVVVIGGLLAVAYRRR